MSAYKSTHVGMSFDFTYSKMIVFDEYFYRVWCWKETVGWCSLFKSHVDTGNIVTKYVWQFNSTED